MVQASGLQVRSTYTVRLEQWQNELESDTNDEIFGVLFVDKV
jgi:hypothetical protein